MSFVDAIKSVFSKYATFSGRARRSEFWFYFLFNMIVTAVLGALARAVPALAILAGLYSLAVLIPSLAAPARRGQIRCLVFLLPGASGGLDLRVDLAGQRQSARRQPVWQLSQII